jgi:hypothetical protein
LSGGLLGACGPSAASASVPHCMERDTASGNYRNICNHPVNFGWAAVAGMTEPPGYFAFVRLEPGEATGQWREVSSTRPEGHRFQTWACKPPRVPGLRTSLSNQNITQRACRRPR